MIRKIDSNIFSLTILKVTTFSRIRHRRRLLFLKTRKVDTTTDIKTEKIDATDSKRLK